MLRAGAGKANLPVPGPPPTESGASVWWLAQVSYSQVMLQMRRTVFCFLLPGDTPSSRRLSDIMIAGCIPVFLGAPWHAMPFADEIQYADFALFFRLDAFQRNSSMCVADVRPVHVVACMPPGLGTLSPNRVCAWAWLRAPRACHLHVPWDVACRACTPCLLRRVPVWQMRTLGCKLPPLSAAGVWEEVWSYTSACRRASQPPMCSRRSGKLDLDAKGSYACWQPTQAVLAETSSLQVDSGNTGWP